MKVILPFLLFVPQRSIGARGVKYAFHAAVALCVVRQPRIFHTLRAANATG